MENCLAEFEPDPGAALDCSNVEQSGREADGLEWVAWDDVDRERSWARDALRHLTRGSAT